MLELKMYLQALWRNWWIIVLTVLSAVGASLLLSSVTAPTYRTSLQLLVLPNMAAYEGRDLIYSLDTLGSRSIVATYVEIVNSRRIYRETVNTLGLEVEERPNYKLSAVALPDTNVLEVSVEGPDPTLVAEMANRAAEETINYVKNTYDIYSIDLLDSASIPVSPISPQPLQDASLALAVGLILGCALAIVRDQVRRPITRAIHQWHALDRESSAFTRAYLERRIKQLFHSGSQNVVLAIIRLEGLGELHLRQPALQRLLHHVTEMLRDELRGRDLIGRWDEISFAVVMLDIVHPEEATRIMERLQYVLSQPVEIYGQGEAILLKPRVGANLSNTGDRLPDLIDRSERALVRASENGYKPVLLIEEPELSAREVELA